MQTPLSIANLRHNFARTLVAVAGVSFAVVLMFVQLGFLGAIQVTARLVLDALDFDLVIRSNEFLHVADPRTVPSIRVAQAASVPGVVSAKPFLIGVTDWKIPGSETGERRAILVIGENPSDPCFKTQEIQAKSRLLETNQSLLIDRKSRPELGAKNRRRFGNSDLGVLGELGGRTIEIVESFELGSGFAADGAVIVNQESFRNVVLGSSPDKVNLVLLRLEEGADVEDCRRLLSQTLPSDVVVLTKNEAIDREVNRWVYQTSAGLVFQIGVAVAMLVGWAIMYQTLSSDVEAHQREYATLKAMGYRNQYLAAVVLSQAFLLSLCGFVVGAIVAQGLYVFSSQVASIPIFMTWSRMVLVFVLTIVLCFASGLWTLQKLFSADPASLF